MYAIKRVNVRVFQAYCRRRHTVRKLGGERTSKEQANIFALITIRTIFYLSGKS
jgi:hypothetical protein